jgi:hypothetical protein
LSSTRWQRNAALPPDICAFGDAVCHRLRRSRFIFDAAWPPVQKVSRLRSDAAASPDLVTKLLLLRESSPRDESVRRRTFGVRTRPRVAFWSGPRRFSAPRTQNASGTLIRSILNEYTDFTKPERALVSNHEAEHHGY